MLNHLEDEHWGAYPQGRAAEFARFERPVRRGTPFTGTLVMIGGGEPVPPEYEAACVAQERYDLEGSAKCCQQVLGIGE
jgi:hypothetical protein